MGKKFRRITAVMTVMLLMLGTISSGFVDQIVADATKTSNIQRLHFGEKGTVLQLDRPISKNPDAIETIVNLANKLNEVKLFDINTLGAYVPEGQGSTLFGSTTDADPMGTGYSYIQFNEGTTEVHTANTKLNKVQDSYGIDDLALSFWCYNGSDSAEPLSTSDTGTFQISSNETVPSNNLIRYVMKDIQLQSGWNYIELPLSEWYYPYGSGENLGKFDIHSIQSFAISGYKNANGTVRRFTNFELKPINSVVVKTVNANELSGNYMIFSNINVSGESAPYALFVTENGYPSVVYGDKQFTLNKNIATGNDVRLKVERDTDGYINF